MLLEEQDFLSAKLLHFHAAQLKIRRKSCDCIVTDLHWVSFSIGAEQGDLRQAEGQIHPQWLHRG